MRVRCRRGGPATVIENVHDAFRLSESVATHSACVTPTGNVVPDSGVQTTDTVPCPLRVSGGANVTVAPALVTADTAGGAGHVSSGGSATGGGGGGVGALGVLLHPAAQVSATTARTIRIVLLISFLSSAVKGHKFSLVHLPSRDRTVAYP